MHREGDRTSRRDFFVCLTLSMGETRLGGESMSHELLSLTVTLRRAHGGTASPQKPFSVCSRIMQMQEQEISVRVIIEAIDAYGKVL